METATVGLNKRGVSSWFLQMLSVFFSPTVKWFCCYLLVGISFSGLWDSTFHVRTQLWEFGL